MDENLREVLNRWLADIRAAGAGCVAAAVSGGPDSMACLRALADLADPEGGPDIHALTVDHGLRTESADEAAAVGRWVKGWPHVRHTVLRWDDPKPATRIMEQARAARYRLMGEYCVKNGIKHIFLAHHRDDQAETFLMRLSAGSGLDGLAGMRGEQILENGLVLIRPFLEIPKAALISFCETRGVPFVRDPGNENPAYARARLRAGQEALEREGLTPQRLAVTARRLERAREALEDLAARAADEALIAHEDGRIVYTEESLLRWPAEIRLRVIRRAVALLGPGEGYGPRLDRLEILAEALFTDGVFRRRSLGGVLFSRRRGQIVLENEAGR